MTVIHIVLFKFKHGAPKPQISDACRRMLELQQICLHPDSETPYILSITGGRDNSQENRQGGFTYGFVTQFTCKEDRNYYVTKDPAHMSFVSSLQSIVEDVRVLDYVPNDFGDHK